MDQVTTELFLCDVFELPEAVYAGDFKVERSGGFVETEQRVEDTFLRLKPDTTLEQWRAATCGGVSFSVRTPMEQGCQ